MIAIPIPIQTPHAPVFDFLFFPLATSWGNPGGFWHDPGRALPADRSERTVEQSSRKQESGSFHENRPLLLAIRELPPPDRCAGLAPMSPTPVGGRLRCSLKELWIEDQLEFTRLRCVSIRVRCVGWRPGRGQRSQRALPQTTMTEDLFHNVSLAALDEGDNFHLRATFGTR